MKETTLVHIMKDDCVLMMHRISKKQDITDTGLPLVISIEEKSIAGMGNVTCAAAAAGSGIVMDTGYFCMLYTLRHKSGRK